MMMANEDQRSSVGTADFPSMDDGSEDVMLDFDCLWSASGEPLNLEQGGVEGFSFDSTCKGSHNSETEHLKLSEIGAQSQFLNFESAYRNESSNGFSEPDGAAVAQNALRINPLIHQGLVENVCTRSTMDCESPHNNCHFNTYFNNVMQNGSSYFQDNDLHYTLMVESNRGASIVQMEDLSTADGNRVACDSSHTDSSSCEYASGEIPDIFSDNGDLCFFGLGDHPSFDPPNQDSFYDSGLKSSANGDSQMTHTTNEVFKRVDDCFGSIPFKDRLISEFEQCIDNGGSENCVSLHKKVQHNELSEILSMENELRQPFSSTFPVSTQNHANFEPFTGSVRSSEKVSRASEVLDGIVRKKLYGRTVEMYEGIEHSHPNSSFSLCHQSYLSSSKDENLDIIGSKRTLASLCSVGEDSKYPAAVAHDLGYVLPVPEQPGTVLSSSIKAESKCISLENESKFASSHLSKSSLQIIQKNSFELGNVDDDSDLCIIEDMSTPARPSPGVVSSKAVASSQFFKSKTPLNPMVTGHPRLKPNAERVIFHVALQDLSQPKSEAAPPDGALAVDLLKHQRIALSWMVHKETKSACCSGGILADDQVAQEGLGKTISTIALILKERPTSKAPKVKQAPSEAETLNLDDDCDHRICGEGAESPVMNGFPSSDAKMYFQAKGRPAAGTLIVCPTSVLRQWSDELHNRVTSEAELSVLVYHGSNRTKDPFELAKYDVVVTTYAIVSMEVPKQPVVNENDDKIGTTFEGYSFCKKRKLHETVSGKKPPKSKKIKGGIDDESLETISGPLAKVGWFRVVLDEAQSIKNHRTQVARACWGLRAKRRWCLSGTPIQNAIDDLYSYFRFLRHEPYAVFRTFCEQIKTPIHRNPPDGYKKLQAVLKTIMLRRTKGTLIDGEPIINLPPKTIEMKKVDFSKEERDFYCRLEAESRAQFAKYAEAGTVRQNYVNILLMLLRLRQACDHPLLVKGHSSNSKMTSAIEIAKGLPREKRMFLLNCLEASLAICGICSDPPEDAIVTVCGHVYCNQCICQHIIADDTQCPTKNCKTHLSLSHVFSITSLRISLSDQLSKENILKCSDSVVEVNESNSLSRPEDSSKIKAALELLSSLPKSHDCAASRISPASSLPKCHDCASRMSSSGSLEGGHCLGKLHAFDSMDGCRNSDINRNSNNSDMFMGEKAIVFSQWTRMLDLLEDCLKNSSIQYRRLDGTMPVAARDRAVKDFNSIPQVTVMIMSLKAASLGLNMVAACHVLLLDLWWNPTTEDQAIDRAHRIGQTRPVSVFRMTVKDTVEDRILALQQRKREMVASAFGEDETGSRQSRLTLEDLKYLFRVN